MNDQAILAKLDAIIAQLQALRAEIAAAPAQPKTDKQSVVVQIGGGPGTEK